MNKIKHATQILSAGLALLCMVGSVANAQQDSSGKRQFSELWGEKGERWDPQNSRLADFTQVGYRRGEVPIPDWPVGVNVKDFGAVPDDLIDDAQAFIDAIAACPDYHAVLVPRGRYTILRKIEPTRDHFVLRGEDMYESVLFFPKYLGEIYIREIGWKPEGRSVVQGEGFLHMADGEEKSIENLSFEFREQRKMGVWEYRGAIPISYQNVSNSWVRNVYIKNYDLGMPISGKNISFINIVLDQFIGRKSTEGSLQTSGFEALFGLMPRASYYNLFHNIDVRGHVMQPLDLNEAPSHNVFSKVRAELRAVGYHGGSSHHNLYTDMNNGVVTPTDNPSRANETYWGVDDTRHPVPPSAYTAKIDSIFVGYGDEFAKKTDHPKVWYEPFAYGKLTPGNLYLAQLQHPAINKPLPKDLPRPVPSPYEGDVFRILPTDDITPGKDPENGALSADKAYLKFDLTEIDVSAVAHARFRLNLTGIRSTPFEISTWMVADDSWSEETVTKANQPKAVSKLDSKWIKDSEDNRVVEFDVTPFVRNQLVGGDGVISLYVNITDGNGILNWFYSVEGSIRPELIVERVPSSIPGPPSAPKGIRSTPLTGNIILDWDDNPESDLATYNVYRDPYQEGRDGYRRSHAGGLVTSDYVDIQSNGDWHVGMMDHRRVYKYKITAVDDHGYESPRSYEFVAATLHPSNDPPTFNETVNLPKAASGVKYSASLQGEAADPESDQLYFMKVSGPDWLEVALDGTLSGKADVRNMGTNTFTFQVTAIGGSTLKTVNISVDPPPHNEISPKEDN